MAVLLRESTRRVLRVLIGSTGEMLTGYQLIQEAPINSGQVYYLLRDLQAAGLVTSRAESHGPGATTKRPRVRYGLTEVGVNLLRLTAASSGH